MARADWRSASAYEDLRPLDAPAFAYEFLLPQSRLSERPRAPGAQQPQPNTRCRGGRSVRPALGGAISGAAYIAARRSAALWTAQALPSVVTLTKAPEDLADPRLASMRAVSNPFSTIDQDDQIVELRGARLRVHRRGNASASQSPCFCHSTGFSNPRRRCAPPVARADRPQAGSRSRRTHA